MILTRYVQVSGLSGLQHSLQTLRPARLWGVASGLSGFPLGNPTPDAPAAPTLSDGGEKWL
jgi:hypothetical protein